MVNIKEILTLVSRKTNLSRKECLDILRQYKVNGRNFNSLDEVVYFIKNPSDLLYKSSSRYHELDCVFFHVFDDKYGFIFSNKEIPYYFNDKKEKFRFQYADYTGKPTYEETFSEFTYYYIKPLKWKPKFHEYFNEDEKVNIKIMFKYLSQYLPKEMVYEILYKL